MNLWKAFALVMIGLLIIAVGIRLAYVESHFYPLDEEQKTFAMNAAKDGLKDEIEGKVYNVTAADHGRIISIASGDRKVTSVVFSYGNTTLVALVDMDTGEVVRKSKTEHSGWMTEYIKSKRRWAHQRFF